jgi:hypothetical protein
MLTLNFQGWFQYRAATDPDPTDDPRGTSGPTTAVAGEPNFDTFIRLQQLVVPRYPHEHDGGVFVRSVMIDGATQADHPLVGAAVDLLDNPTYQERGYIITYQKVPVDPFNLSISGGGITLRRAALWDVSNPHLNIVEVCKHHPELIPPRQPTLAAQSTQVAEATGIMNYREYRRRRKEELIKQLADPNIDPIQRLALSKRIDNLAKDDLHMTGITLAAQQFLGLCATYNYTLNGTPHVEDPDGKLKGEIGTSMVWPVSFWMGGYDVDSLFGYMSGSLSVPFWPLRQT